MNNSIALVLNDWVANRNRCPRGDRIGCCRVYVSITLEKGDRKTKNELKKACKNLGLIFQDRNYYGNSNAIYIGYDNADGIALGQGEDLVHRLKNAGFSAYLDYHGD